MNKRFHHHLIISTIIVVLLASSAFICRSGQPTSKPPTKPPEETQPPAMQSAKTKEQGVEVALVPPKNCKWKLASVPTNIVLEWKYDGLEDIDGFIIYLATTDVVKWVGPEARNTMTMNLELNTQYHYDVRTYKGDKQSPPDACFVDATTGKSGLNQPRIPLGSPTGCKSLQKERAG